MTGASLKIGADPEFFVRRGRHWISGHVFNCGTKQFPMLTDNGSVQVDGVALECNVQPAETEDDFVQNCQSVIADLTTIVKTVDPRCAIFAQPSIFLGQRYLATLPDEARDLGCTPDWNAHTGRTNPRPNKEAPFRTGAGHIHLGWTEDENERSVTHFQTCQKLVGELDYAVGLPSLAWDRDKRRRSLYGQAGAFRPKPYGCEYRVLSNRWLSEDRLMREVFRRTRLAYENVRRGDTVYSNHRILAEHIINSNVTNWQSEFPDLAADMERYDAR